MGIVAIGGGAHNILVDVSASILSSGVGKLLCQYSANPRLQGPYSIWDPLIGPVKGGGSTMLTARSDSDINVSQVRRPADYSGATSASQPRIAFKNDGMRYHARLQYPRTACEVHLVAMQISRSSFYKSACGIM